MGLFEFLKVVLSFAPTGKGPPGFEWWQVDPKDGRALRHRENWIPMLKEDLEGLNRFQRKGWLRFQHMFRARGYMPDLALRENNNGRFYEVSVEEPPAMTFLCSEMLCWEIAGERGRVDFLDADTPWQAMNILGSEIQERFPPRQEFNEDGTLA